MQIKELFNKLLILIEIIGIIGIIVVTGAILYRFFSTIKVPEKTETSSEDLEQFIKQPWEEESQQKLLGCDWYKDNCPENLKRSSSPIYGEDPNVEGEEFGLIFLKADIGKSSLGQQFMLSCCKNYYPQTETVVDWGTDVCVWEGVSGDCLPESAVIAPLGKEELLCKMDPDNPSANTFIRKCMKNTETYYWCCPNE